MRMASEDRCRLTYAEGIRIRTEAQRPYLKKAAVLLMAALGVVIVGGFVSNFLAGLPIYGSGSGVRLLGQMILEGDAGAIETLYDFTDRMNFITFTGGGLMAFGLAFFVLADTEGREAVKKANDEKEQGIREAQEGTSDDHQRR